MTEPEYQAAVGDPRFANLRLEETLPYPDGSPGFRFVWLAYAANFDALLAKEREGWRRLVEDEVEIGGEKARVSHSIFDVGEARHLFDGDDRTLVRTEKANPAVVVVEFARPRTLRQLSLTTGSMEMEVSVELSGPSGEASLARTYKNLPLDPTVDLDLPAIGGPVAKLRIAVRDINSAEPQPVHLREVRLR
jgi:hypothetical protein